MPPLNAVWDLLCYAILPAFATAAIVTAAVERIGGPKQAPTGAALGLIAGVALGFWLRSTLPFVPGDSTWNRLPWAALIALCVDRVSHLTDDGNLFRGAASFGLAWWVIPENVRTEIPWLTIAFAAVMWLNWMLLEMYAGSNDFQPPNTRRLEVAATEVGVCVILSLLIAGGVLVFAGIARYMEAAIVLAMAFAGVTVVAVWRQFDLRAAIPAIAVFLPGLLVMGNCESSVETIHWAAFVLPAIAPLILAVSLPFEHWPRKRLIALRIGLVLIPLIIAMILARQGGSLDFGEPEW
jgi:hypothetical protein